MEFYLFDWGVGVWSKKEKRWVKVIVGEWMELKGTVTLDNRGIVYETDADSVSVI